MLIGGWVLQWQQLTRSDLIDFNNHLISPTTTHPPTTLPLLCCFSAPSSFRPSPSPSFLVPPPSQIIDFDLVIIVISTGYVYISGEITFNLYVCMLSMVVIWTYFYTFLIYFRMKVCNLGDYKVNIFLQVDNLNLGHF